MNLLRWPPFRAFVAALLLCALCLQGTMPMVACRGDDPAWARDARSRAQPDSFSNLHWNACHACDGDHYQKEIAVGGVGALAVLARHGPKLVKGKRSLVGVVDHLRRAGEHRIAQR